MTPPRHPLWELLDKLQMDNREQARKLVELRARFAALDLPEGSDRPRCPVCRISFRSQRSIAEHVYNSHDGPVPEHVLAAEARAA